MKYLDFYNHKSKIQLETATHPCPKCKCSDGVQLTRFRHELTVLKRTISLPNDMSVKYACKYCNWKRKALPDDDPFFNIFSNESSIENYFIESKHRYCKRDDDYSIMHVPSIDRPATFSTESSASSLSAKRSGSSRHRSFSIGTISTNDKSSKSSNLGI